MAAPSWTRTDRWESLTLGGLQCPGVAHVDISYASGVDIQKPRDAKKARVRDTGTPPAEVHVRIELLEEELLDLEPIIALLRPRQAFAARSELSITHPNCALWGINRVLVGTVRSPQPGPGGSYTLEFSATEYVQQPKKVKQQPAKVDEAAEHDVDALISRLRPSQSGAPQANFTSGESLQSFDPGPA